jgi:SAM-dependent methyltransferase
VSRLRRARLRIMEAWHRSGVLGVGAALVGLVRSAASIARTEVVGLATDLRLGVRTRGVVHNGETLNGVSACGDAEWYEPVNPVWWRQVLRALPMQPEETTFVDLGAGRGRALVLAARSGFRRVIGVELDAALHRDAVANVERWARRRVLSGGAHARPTVVHGDAATFALPDGPMLVHLYNPFGPATLRRVLNQVCRRPPGATYKVAIAYLVPEHAEVFDEFPELELYARDADWAVYRLRGAA